MYSTLWKSTNCVRLQESEIHDRVRVYLDGEMIKTTVGRVIFNIHLRKLLVDFA